MMITVNKDFANKDFTDYFKKWLTKVSYFFINMAECFPDKSHIESAYVSPAICVWYLFL